MLKGIFYTIFWKLSCGKVCKNRKDENYMKNLTQNMSLLDLEKKFEEEITSVDNNIRIIGDLNISYEDYITIREKINALMDYKDNITVWNQYRLCTLVSWVFSIIYEDADYNATSFMESLDGFHQ